MKNLDYYILCFTHLRRAPNNGGAPHKPILLLSILDCIEKGYILDNRIYITPELIAYFKSNWQIWVKSKHIMNFSMPFYHMSGEPFWNLILKPGCDLKLDKSNSIKSFNLLNTVVDYALMDDQLMQLLFQPDNRQILRTILIDKYFPTIHHYTASNMAYLDSIADEILHDSAIQYMKKIENIKQKENIVTFEEEIFLRNYVFKKQIPLIYDNTCCISGLKINTWYNISMIDACHIIPFSQTHDDTIGNGLALCPNLHRAFDRGLISIDENYKIVVSNIFKEDKKSTHSIIQFDRKEINLPSNEKFHPKMENLLWHRNNIFRSSQ
ncbi:HNH endonuclease [Prevotella sp. 10(H)]|uniref:HNH endonuclease n=1 Tax=Prevotella sp. 10(H) TaxID=1158294 RepID=UPI0004A6AB12|nr:HNH endonuclease [Prevotella sp. 10(H)]